VTTWIFPIAEGVCVDTRNGRWSDEAFFDDEDTPKTRMRSAREYPSNGIKPNPRLTSKIARSGGVGWSSLKHPFGCRDLADGRKESGTCKGRGIGLTRRGELC